MSVDRRMASSSTLTHRLRDEVGPNELRASVGRMSTPSSSMPKEPVAPGAWLCLFAAWVVALAASLGALFIGEVLGQAPCLLCWYQRMAMFPLVLILGIACLRDDTGAILYAGALCLAGGLVASWHTALYLELIPKTIEPCSQGPSCTSSVMTILGGLPIPALSVAAFVVIGALLILARQWSRR